MVCLPREIPGVNWIFLTHLALLSINTRSKTATNDVYFQGGVACLDECMHQSRNASGAGCSSQTVTEMLNQKISGFFSGLSLPEPASQQTGGQ